MDLPDTLFTRTPDELDALLGYYLRQRGFELGLSLAELSHKLKVPEDMILTYQKGQLVIPDSLIQKWIALVHGL